MIDDRVGFVGVAGFGVLLLIGCSVDTTAGTNSGSGFTGGGGSSVGNGSGTGSGGSSSNASGSASGSGGTRAGSTGSPAGSGGANASGSGSGANGSGGSRGGFGGGGRGVAGSGSNQGSGGNSEMGQMGTGGMQGGGGGMQQMQGSGNGSGVSMDCRSCVEENPTCASMLTACMGMPACAACLTGGGACNNDMQFMSLGSCTCPNCPDADECGPECDSVWR